MSRSSTSTPATRASCRTTLCRTRARAAAGDDPERLAALEAEQDQERDGEGDDTINVRLREMKDERFAWEDPLPGRMKVAWKDVLPKVNVDLRPYLRTLRFLDASTQDRVSTELCHMALQEHNDSWAPLFRYLPDSLLYLLYPSGVTRVTTLHALQPEVDKLLFGVDWETRGLNALALLWESPVCDDMVGPFLTTMKVCSPGSRRSWSRASTRCCAASSGRSAPRRRRVRT